MFHVEHRIASIGGFLAKVVVQNVVSGWFEYGFGAPFYGAMA